MQCFASLMQDKEEHSFYLNLIQQKSILQIVTNDIKIT